MKLKPLIALPFVLAALALAGCADKTPEQHIASAKESLQKNDTAAAVVELKSALQKNVHSGEARFLLGSTLLKQGNPQTAEVELRKAQEANYPAAEVVPELARAMLMQGQARKVVDEFGLMQLGVPGADARLQTVLASAYGVLGKAEQAQSALAAALAADPQYAEALLLSARQKAAARDIDGALAVVDEVVARETGNAEAWMLKGDLVLFGKNQPDEAIAAYRKALASEPKHVAAHFAVFNLLLGQRKLDEATKQLEELKKSAAKNPQTRFMEAQLAYYKRDFKAARDLAQELLREAPNSARVLELAGAAELQAGIPLQAEGYLARALQLAPERAMTRRLLIMSYLRSGQPAKALAELNAATGKGGMPPALYSLAGEVHLHNGDAKKAEDYFSKALALDPDDTRKRTALAITRLAGGNDELAIGELQDIAATDSGTTADLALISAHLHARDHTKALAAIDKLDAKQPDQPLAAMLRGRVLLAQQDPAGARKSFERALSIDPNYFAAAASLAQLDLADKKPEDAKKRFEGLLAKNPKNGQALLALAELAASQKAPTEEVAGLLGKAIDANPTDATPRLLLIDLHLRNSDSKQALATAQGAVAALPTSPDLLAALGRLQMASGETNQAAATFGKLVALQPLSPLAYVWLAEAQIAVKSMPAAEQSLRKALELKLDDLGAQRLLIAVLIDANRYPEAIKLARQVQAQRPKQAFGWVFEGDIAASRKDWDAAIAAYRSGLQQVRAPMLAIKLHAALADAGKGPEADRHAASWQAARPKDAAFVDYLATLALARKDYAAAQKHYAALVKLQPENALALNNLAWSEQQTGSVENALQHAQRAYELAPDQPRYMDTLAGILSARGEHEKAIALQQKAVERLPTSQSLKLRLAKIYLAAGDKSKARSELQTLARLDETSPIRAEAQALLAKM
jgi:putative PEP-CTERM system TPR-repeat lipoprotein